MQDILLKSIFVILLLLSSCSSGEVSFNANNYNDKLELAESEGIIPAAERVAKYFPLLENKNIGLVVNQTSMVEEVHLVDTLIQLGVSVKKIYAPEHGFRGTADAGEKVKDGVDPGTGIQVLSLYGSKRKPGQEDLKDIDLMVFDIQDVGARFYTYISTLTYVMEACAENNIPVIVLDRPNPNGYYIDGPVLENDYSSFVGLHEVPVVYGMTIGEYGKMVNGELWMKNGIQCDLTVIQCKNYNHTMTYDLPVKPSPNLPNHRSVLLYPSLCFFEGTIVSVGRGTKYPFQHIGHPDIKNENYSFTPKSSVGAKYPKLQDKKCHGTSFIDMPIEQIVEKKSLDITHLIEYYKLLKDRDEEFFLENLFFDKLAGTDKLRTQILAGMDEEEIRSDWKKDIDDFKLIRTKYLIYPDFE